MLQSLMVSFAEVHSILKETLAILKNNEIYENFKVHASKRCEQDITIMFGTDSFLVTVFCYIQLYTAIPCQNLASLKFSIKVNAYFQLMTSRT